MDMATLLMDTATPPMDTAVRPMDMATLLMDMATPLMDTAILPTEDTAILLMDTETLLMALMDTEEEVADPATPGPGNPVQCSELAALTISVRFRVWSKIGPRGVECLVMEDSLSKQDLCSTLLESLSTSDLSQLGSSSSLEGWLGRVVGRRDMISTDNPTI